MMHGGAGERKASEDEEVDARGSQVGSFGKGVLMSVLIPLRAKYNGTKKSNIRVIRVVKGITGIRGIRAIRNVSDDEDFLWTCSRRVWC